MDYSQAFKFPLALEIRARFIRLLPETSADLACMRVELYGYEGVRNVPFYANYFITTLPFRRALFVQIKRWLILAELTALIKCGLHL